MERVSVTKVELSKNHVDAGEKITIRVFASSIVREEANERLAFRLGGGKPKT